MSQTPLEPEIRQVVKMALDAHQPESIEIIIQPNLPSLLCDRLWVHTIFQNLIANAIKYNDQPQKRIEIGCNQSVEPAVFYIRDNGIGIEPAHHGAVFQLFSRLHERNAYGGGSGAGLSIVKRAVERHGGHIWLESNLGQGTTFFFTLTPARKLEAQDG
jgi:signal transduction histidine kinase